MNEKLTYRQQRFLNQFLEIYQETKQPLHYVFVAERLGIGKVTAYEMLRLLEKYGLIRAEYQKKSNSHGPGRSIVLFYPTPKAKQRCAFPPEDTLDLSDWVTTKDQILQKLRTGEPEVYKELLDDILVQISEGHSPQIFITELITSVILILNSLQDSQEVQSLFERLQRIGLPKNPSLHIISGIATFLLVVERSNRHYSSILLAQINRYEEAISQLSNEYLQFLSEFTREAVQIVTS